MTWRYEQSTGNLTHAGAAAGHGYAGRGDHKNIPASQSVHGEGPLPQGWYSIGPAFKHPHLGPLSMPLAADPGNTMFGRSGFYIHGDSIATPGWASHGCIVMPHDVRERIAESKDRRLQVVPGPRTSEEAP